MAVESMKKHVNIVIKTCNGLVLSHPLMVITFFVMFWMYRFVPFLFWILVRASPVIATTLLLLGTLLYYGHAKAEKEGNAHPHNLRFVDKSYFVDKNLNQEKQSEVFEKSKMKISSNSIDQNNNNKDDKEWEMGSDLDGSSSSSRSSMDDMIPMLDELDPLLDSEVRQHTHMSNGSDHSFEANDHYDDYNDDGDDDEHAHMELNDDDEDDEEEDEDDIVITWTEDDQRNVTNMGTSEIDRNRALENLIARQQTLKNMRMIAETNMLNLSQDLGLNATHISTARTNPFDHSYDSDQHILGSAPSVIMPRRNNPFDLPYDDPSGQKLPNQVGPTNDPFIRLHESFDSGPSANLGPFIVPKRVASDTSLHTQVGEDDPSTKDDSNAAGDQEKSSDKSSSSSFFDVADDIYDGDDDDDEEFRSVDMPSAQDLNDLQMEDSSTDSSVSDSEPKTESRLSQMTHELKSWLTGRKA